MVEQTIYYEQNEEADNIYSEQSGPVVCLLKSIPFEQIMESDPSRSAYNVENEWRSRGGDNRKLPKEVYHRGKLR